MVKKEGNPQLKKRTFRENAHMFYNIKIKFTGIYFAANVSL